MALIWLLLFSQSDGSLKAEWATTGKTGVRITGWRAPDLIRTSEFDQAQLNRFLKVYVGETPPVASPSVLGQVNVIPDGLAFEPRYPLIAGEQYVAVLALDMLEGERLPWTDSYVIPKSPGSSPTVTAVYPMVEVVPANLLRFYIQFSQPMSENDPHAKVHLNVNGETVDLPFVEVPNGLWNKHRTRLTLILHPGRIKREVGPNIALGPIISSGDQIELVVDAAFAGGELQPMPATFRQSYMVGEPIRTGFDPMSWQFEIPSAGSKDALTIKFDRALDQILLDRMVTIETKQPTSIKSSAFQLSFLPVEAWQRGAFNLVFDPALEDLAGNRPGRAFDHDSEIYSKNVELTHVIHIQ